MERVNIYGKDLKRQLQDSRKDRITNFILKDGEIRGALIHGTKMVREMRANHQLGILETLILGHAYMAGGLISANLKGNDRVALQVQCSGPAKGLSVEATASGEVRGHLKTVPIPIEGPMTSFDTSPFFGAGFLTITKYLESAKQPYSGQIMLQNGNLAQDLAAYFLQSEQTPTSFSLSIKFDKEGEVTGAGGLFLQAMPGASEETVAELEEKVTSLPSLGEVFTDNQDQKGFIETTFESLSPSILADSRVEFFCRCTEKGIRNYLAMLPDSDMEELLKGPFPVKTTCHNCNTLYAFSEAEIRELMENRKYSLT